MLAIICGNGEYPLDIAAKCQELNIDFVLVFLKGFANIEQAWPPRPYVSVGLGEVRKMLDFCSEHGVESVVFAGGVKRPSFSDISFDSEGRKWLRSIGKKIFCGDDGLLRAISDLFEQHGISVVSGQAILAQECGPDKSIYTIKQPSDIDLLDIEKGVSVLDSLGDKDVGQAVIVESGLVLGIECVEGTDALITRIRSLKKQTVGGVLVKMSKKGQDTRLDLPTIGINTIKNVHNVGLNGIAIDRKKSIILNKKQIIDYADKHGLFIIER